MTDETEGPPHSGGENEGAAEDIASRGDEGRRAAGVTPPIADDAEPGRTTSPSEPGDVGVPPDEEMNEPDR
jgi:hypothetical protein